MLRLAELGMPICHCPAWQSWLFKRPKYLCHWLKSAESEDPSSHLRRRAEGLGNPLIGVVPTNETPSTIGDWAVHVIRLNAIFTTVTTGRDDFLAVQLDQHDKGSARI